MILFLRKHLCIHTEFEPDGGEMCNCLNWELTVIQYWPVCEQCEEMVTGDFSWRVMASTLEETYN